MIKKLLFLSLCLATPYIFAMNREWQWLLLRINEGGRAICIGDGMTVLDLKKLVAGVEKIPVERQLIYGVQRKSDGGHRVEVPTSAPLGDQESIEKLMSNGSTNFFDLKVAPEKGEEQK